jgi:hypothetical protein
MVARMINTDVTMGTLRDKTTQIFTHTRYLLVGPTTVVQLVLRSKTDYVWELLAALDHICKAVRPEDATATYDTVGVVSDAPFENRACRSGCVGGLQRRPPKC